VTRRFFKEQKPAQIAEEMRMPLREVENRLYRIKGSIRKKMSL
jgi:DNA-directed RNA polymerase specialized sigma24 family protein